MDSIWPQRSIALPRVETMAGWPWLDSDKIEGIRSCFNPKVGLLDKPVIIEPEVMLLALVLLGDDGISGNNSLLLRVTDERFFETGPEIVLKIVPYGRVAGSDPWRKLRPGEAGDLLDQFVELIKEELGPDPVQPPPTTYGR